MPQTLTPNIFRISVRPTMNAPGLHSLSSSARTRTSSATASHRRSLVNRPAGLIAPWKKEPEYDSDDQLVPESVKARPVLLLAAGLLRAASKAVADDLASAAGDYLRPQQLALGTPVGLSPLPPTSQQRRGATTRPGALGAHGAVDFQDAYQHPDRIAVVEALFNATDKNGEHMSRHLVPAALARHGVSTKIRASNGRGEEMARLVVLRYLSCTSAYGCSRSSSAWTRS